VGSRAREDEVVAVPRDIAHNVAAALVECPAEEEEEDPHDDDGPTRKTSRRYDLAAPFLPRRRTADPMGTTHHAAAGTS